MNDHDQLIKAHEDACLRGDEFAARYLDAALARLTLAEFPDNRDDFLARLRRANIATARAMVTGCLIAKVTERLAWWAVSR